MLKSFILLASIILVISQPNIGGDEAPANEIAEEQIRLPVHAEVHIFAGTSKIAKGKFHLGETKRATETLPDSGSDLDTCSDSHRGMYIKELNMLENKKSDTGNVFTQVEGGYIIPYRFMECPIEVIFDPLLGAAFKFSFSKGEGNYQSEIYMTFGTCNEELDQNAINELYNMLNLLCVSRHDLLNEIKKKLLETASVFVRHSQDSDVFKNRKVSVAEEIISHDNAIEDAKSQLEIIEEEVVQLEASYKEKEDEYVRILNERKELEEKRNDLYTQKAYLEDLQIRNQTLITSNENLEKECSDIHNKIKDYEKTMNWYHGAVNFNGCFNQDLSMNCECISRYRP